ncbi:hypothetical protein KJ708_03405, partial [bacterium]|nr:hypothetical protein [bacterium]
AILMNDDYYQFILSSRDEFDGIPFVGLEYIIPLKARAWLDLVERQNKGEKVQNSTIKKHKNDIFRLYQAIDPETRLDFPSTVKSDLSAFFEAVKSEDINLKNLGVVGQSLDTVLQKLKVYYCL